MSNIDIAKKLKDPEELAKVWIKSLPKGYLYNYNLVSFIKSFCESYSVFLKDLNTGINDLFDVTADNIFLEELKAEYGVPNTIFPTINTNEEAALAITAMKTSKNLLSVEDFKTFMLLLGYDVEFYQVNNLILELSSFSYGFPVVFTPAISKKDKLTYLVYINNQNNAETDFFNLGDAFAIDFVPAANNVENIKNILDFIKPDYIIFEYITTETKNLYGL
jgi:hypothetical protein